MSAPSYPILKALSGEAVRPLPCWFMRQAGRHLPEYLEVRATTPDFISFCLTPDKAAEVTLQPIRRYGMDAAILFADILLIPRAMGRDVRFVKGTGPVLDPMEPDDVAKLVVEGAAEALSPVYETVRKVRAGLDADHPGTALIGFAGGPWTVATYMLEGRGTPTKEAAKRFAYVHARETDRLLDQLADATADYLVRQAEAGAQVLKIFESWASGLSPALFERLVIRPTARIVDAVRAAGVSVPIIGFPRGAGLKAIDYALATHVDALALGADTPLRPVRAVLPSLPLQGNLDPLALRIGGEVLRRAVDDVLATASGPHIFNLGHGVTPDVRIENMHAVITHLRGGDPTYVPGALMETPPDV